MKPAYNDINYAPIPLQSRDDDDDDLTFPIHTHTRTPLLLLLKRYRGFSFSAVTLFLGLIVGLLIGRWSRTPSTIFDSFQDINHMSPAHHPFTSPSSEEKAVVTSLYNDGYAIAVSTLGYSLSQANTTARKIVIYLPDRVSEYSLCHVKAAGWEPYPVSFVNPPHGGKHIWWQFVDQYTKLRIWTLDQIGIKSAVYLDADTLVKSNFDELFESPFEFGAVPDVYSDYRGFTIGFNAGVMVFKPDTRVFDDMLAKVEDAKYRLMEAEQSYLNLYFGQQAVRLPHVYNSNLAIKVRSRSYWDAMVAQMRIVHFTVVKPFDGRPSCGDNACTVEEIFDPARHRKDLERAKVDRGMFREEIEWWGTVYEEMMIKVGDVCQTTH